MNKLCRICFPAVILALLIPVALCAKTAGKLQAVRLLTEYKSNPVGLGEKVPRLSWQLESTERHTLQTAYRIEAALSMKDLSAGKNLLWDSEKVISGESIQIPFMGKPFHSGQRVYWRVKIWDNHGQVSPWSEMAFWEAGLLEKSDWKAQWIEPVISPAEDQSVPSSFLRKEFSVRKKIRSARIYATCHGLYEIHLNGKPVGDQLFAPGWTSYHKRLQYQVYDVTSLLKQGENALGVILGTGWYVGPFGFDWRKDLYGENVALLLQMNILYEDGTEALILSDPSWKFSAGPIFRSELYNGEVYDARKELTGWDLAGYNDKNWEKCRTAEFAFDNLTASEGAEVRVIKTLKPVKKIITPNGETVLDMGQNMVGRVEFRLKGDAGSKITLHHAEVLDKEGNFYTDNLRKARQEVQYVFKGTGTETWHPHFTFMGFRYIRISDYPGEVNPDDFNGQVISSDMIPTGSFICSDPLINRLQENIQWGLRGNFLDVPTDCPQRDERLGWTGDAQVFAPTACFNCNAAPFFTKWLKDLAADQKPDGSVPWVVPNIIIDGGGTGWSDGYGATGWADAAVVIPWTVYQVYGDKRILEQQYASMMGWVDYMIREAGEDYLLNTGFHFGDWLSFAEYYSYRYHAPDYGYAGANTDKDLVATAYMYYSSGLLHKIAALLNKPEDQQRIAEIRPKIKAAFQKEFLTSTGRLSSNTQTAYILALSFGLIPEELKKAAAQRLAADVDYFGHLTTGFLGTPLILQTLSDNGFPDLAYRLLFNKRYPSWLYPVTMGATTIWERWDGIKPDSTFQTAGMNSFNHYAYGAVGDWMYTRVAGLKRDPEIPGYKKIIIHPELTGKLQYAEAELHSMYGRTISGWKQSGDSLAIHVVLPANTTGKVILPVPDAGEVTESGVPLRNLKDILVTENKGENLVVTIGSGEYHFRLKKQ